MKKTILFVVFIIFFLPSCNSNRREPKNLYPEPISTTEVELGEDAQSTLRWDLKDSTTVWLLDSLKCYISEWGTNANTAYEEHNFKLSEQIIKTLSIVTERTEGLIDLYPDGKEDLEFILSSVKDAIFYCNRAVENKQEAYFDKCSIDTSVRRSFLR